MRDCRQGAQGRRAGRGWRDAAVGRWPAGIAAAGACALVTLGLPSCSETKEPLDWSAATRPGLGDAPEFFHSDTLVVADAGYNPAVLTGAGLYLLAGHVVREDPFAGELTGRAYLKWDLSGLPAGEVTAARLDLILRDVSNPDPTEPDSFVFQMHEVLEGWAEDSLGTEPFPAVGEPVAGGRGSLAVAGVNDSSDVALFGAFRGEGLRALVTAWRDNTRENNGLVIQPAPDETQQGFLRFISSEGEPRGTVVKVNTPVLQVTIATATGDTTISREPAADGYVVAAHLPGSSAPIVAPDSLLLLGMGHVQGLLFDFDLPALLASDPVRFPAGLAVHQATLHLTAVRDTDWSLAAGQQMTILPYQTPTAWTEEAPPSAIALEVALPATTVSGDDGEVVLDVRDAVQAMVGGADASLAVICSSATSQFRSLLCKSREAALGRPELRIVFSRPSGGRLSAGEEGS